MNPIKAFYCRAVQGVLRAALPVLPYREPEIFHSCGELKSIFEKEHLQRVLVVTDPGILRGGIADRLLTVLEDNGVDYALYADTRPNPTVQNVEQALALYRKHSCQGLIAIGGGSSMDCAKAVGARIARPHTPLGMLKGTLRILHKLPPLIAIPTTAGTGSEATLAAVITDSETKHKYVMNDFVLIPRYAVLDASLTASLPPHLTATTGMDALTHAVEAYGECIHKKLHDLGIAAGVCTPEQSDKDAAAAFIRSVRELNARMGIPEQLEGIRPEDIPTMAKHAEKEANPLYPVPRLMTQAELEPFYRKIAKEAASHGKQAS